MRRVIAAVALVLLLAPGAAAQTAGGPPLRTGPTQAEVAAQASFGTGYLLALYMAQLAAQGTPPSPADVDEAARLYFTNGAAAVGVPSSGPGAAYFRNGAQVMAYPTASPPPPTEAVRDAGVGGVAGASQDASAAPVVPQAAVVPQTEAEEGAEEASPVVAAAVGRAPASEVSPASSVVTPPTTSQPTLQAPPPPAAVACPPASTSSGSALVPPATRLVSAEAPAPRCPGPSVLSRVVPVLGGALFGALSAVLWSRPRTVRATRARKAG